MPLVRVKLHNGDEASVGSDYAEAEGLTVLDKPATNLYGAPLPAKVKRNLADLGPNGETSQDTETGTNAGAPATADDDTSKEQ